MVTNTNNLEYEYKLKNIIDSKGMIEGGKIVVLTEADANNLNYARALNGSPDRLVKVTHNK
jgi:hypothetical protein